MPLSNAPGEFFLEDESEATHGSDDLGAAASARTWLGGVALGLSSHGDDHIGAVYPFPEDDCYGSNSCYRVLQACARSPDAHVQRGSTVMLPDAQCQAVCALHPLNPLLGDSRLGYFNEVYRAYEEIGCAIELVAADRVSAALHDAGGAVSELTALRAERKALLTTLAAVATATSGAQVIARRGVSMVAVTRQLPQKFPAIYFLKSGYRVAHFQWRLKDSKMHDRRSSALKENHSDQRGLDYSTEWKS